MSITTAFITGTGLVTPLGETAQETWNALLAGRFIKTHSKCAEYPEPSSLPRVSRLAIRAARQAMAAAGTSSDWRETALVLGTSKGSVESWLSDDGSDARSHRTRPASGAAKQKNSASFVRPDRRASQSIIRPQSTVSGVADDSFGLSTTATDVAGALDLHGPRLTLSAACASGLHALIRAAMLIQSGECKRVLVVAAEASAHPLFLASFHRLGVLADEAIGCRPFDARRCGFMMSESAAAVLLETTPRLGPVIFVEHFALGADATHLTGIDPRGGALRHILSSVLQNRPIDLLHAHGTATEANDPVELAALDDLVVPGAQPPHLYSHKAALGHSLGAAGLISVAINVMCHQNGMIPPNVLTTDPLPARHVRIAQASIERPIHRSLAVAAGFGGAMAAVTMVASPAD